MAFLGGDRVELVPLDPDDDAHVEAYRRSRVDPRMRATGASDRGGLTTERARVAGLAYYVLPEWQGRGYATEAARLLAGYAFDELNARRLEAHVLAGNPASVRVLETLGFTEEGRKRGLLPGGRVPRRARVRPARRGAGRRDGRVTGTAHRPSRDATVKRSLEPRQEVYPTPRNGRPCTADGSSPRWGSRPAWPAVPPATATGRTR